jgi:DNA-binding NarL/FixJ family response regulator
MLTDTFTDNANGRGQKLLFVDDHQIILDALCYMASPHYEVRSVDNLAQFEQMLDSYAPDLVILDVAMADGSGLDAASRLLSERPGLKILFLSMYTDPTFVRRALDSAASGYLSKNAPYNELLAAIRTILAGGKYIPSRMRPAPEVEGGRLTERQTEVLRLISQGFSAKEIASSLNISVRTAEFHRAAIMDRLKLHSTAMMTRYALERGIVCLEHP